MKVSLDKSTIISEQSKFRRFSIFASSVEYHIVMSSNWGFDLLSSLLVIDVQDSIAKTTNILVDQDFCTVHKVKSTAVFKNLNSSVFDCV